ncbi:MAG: CocE/NonD family hydrolase [Actinomycetota bacterium]|nr:CocE/NonD family hydrolase [Actinomycetota bacterium]
MSNSKPASIRGLVAVVTAALASTLLVQAPAAAAGLGSTDITVKGKAFDYRTVNVSPVKYKHSEIIRDKFDIPMTAPEPTHPGQTVELHVEVVRPKKVQPYPTILEVSPYHGTIADRSGTRIFPGPKKNPLPDYVDSDGKGGTPGDITLGLAGYFAPRGYAVVFVDLRGMGKSTGCLDHLGPQDQSDAEDVLKWIAKQKWSNGRIGMTGHSYVGSTPQMYAATHHPALKTIAPSAGLAAMYHHKFQTGVPYFLQWIGPAEAYEELSINRHLPGFLGTEYGDSFGDGTEWIGCGLPDSAVMSEADFDSGVYDDEEPFPWDAERDFRKGVTKADIPIFLIHGVNDNAARIPAIDWFYKRNGRKGDKAWIGNWDHGSGIYPNDRTCPQHGPVLVCPAVETAGDQWTLALHAWFDKHLMRRNVNTGPAVEIFLNNHQVYQPSQWPPGPFNRRNRLFLAPNGKLLPEAPNGKSTDMFIGSPQGELNEYSAENELGTNALGWDTAPLKKPMLLAGTPRLHLSMSQDVERLHIIGTLYDIAPDGSVVCVPITNSSRCGISKATFAMNPELRKTIREITPVPTDPQRRMHLRQRGMAQAYVVEKGHRLRFVVATAQPDKVATHAEGTVTVFMDGKHPSRIALPLVTRATLKRDFFPGPTAGF